jgi:membrane fusion protein (multidrug efflux system)
MKVTPGFGVIGLAALAFVGWLGVRVSQALKTRESMAQERAATVEKAKGEAASVVAAGGATRTVVPKAETWAPSVGLEGTLRPAREADVGSRVPGRLQSIRVRIGGRVGAGEVLGTLEANDAEAQVQVADAQLRASEAQLALADDSARRTAKLVTAGSASEAMGVQTSEQRSLVVAQRDAAKGNKALAEAALKNHVITAPFDGTITKVPTGVGGVVGPGTPLYHLQDLATLRLVGSISDQDVELVHIGDPVDIEVGGRAISGKVVAVVPSVDPGTRRVPVEVELKNDAKNPILAGVFVRARIKAGRKIPVLRVPAQVLRPGAQDEVMVVKGGKLEARNVVYSVDESGDLMVRSGLQQAEPLLAAPSAEAKTGEVVK